MPPIQDFSGPSPAEPSNSASATSERRRSERRSFSAMAEVVEDGSQARIAARVADISAHGCYLDTLNVFVAGSAVQISIREGDTVFRVEATVMYAVPGMGMGLRFASPPPDMRSILDRWASAAPEETSLTAPSGGSVGDSGRYPNVERRILNRLIGLMVGKGLLTKNEAVDLLNDLLLGE